MQGYAQLTAWQYRVPMGITDTSGLTQTNYQVRLSVNTAAPIGAGHMLPTGDDIRFADSCGVVVYEHFVESGMNSANTIIWVRVPSIAANGTAVCFMYYGNASATAVSSFSGTFPAAFISGGLNSTLTGIQTYDWFQVDVNDTVFMTAGTALTINARNIIIDGVVSGNGSGYQAPGINTAGTGPGGGGTSTNSGCGGGSYGSVGGTGGMDAGDTPGTGGPAYGTAGGTDIDMGSSGGSGTGISFNGHGGGAVITNADYVSVNGSIHVNGASPSFDGTGRGAGGGAGGGILILAGHVTLAGVFSADGGNGASGTSTANDSGGGGAGGRVKTFYSGTSVNTSTATANGGIGGPYGTAAPGQPGTAGSISNLNAGSYDVPSVLIGGEVSLAAPTLVISATNICAGDTINATATAGYTTYSFLVNGNPVSTGTTNSYTYTGLSNGDILSVSVTIDPCYTLVSNTDTISITANSIAGTAMATSSICQGGTDTLMTQGSTGVITWFEYDGSNYNLVGTGDPLFPGPMNTAGTFTFVAVANNGGCAIDTSSMVTTIVNSAPVAGTVSTTLADTNLCAFDSLWFTANGSNGNIAWYVQFGQVGPYGLFGSGNPFNPGPPSNQDVGAYNFIAVATAPGCPDDTSAALPLYVRATPEVSLGNDTTLCAGPLVLDAGNPGESYLWSNFDTTQQVSVTSSNTYIVFVTTMYGCAGSDTIELTINPNPVVTFSTPSTVCVDDGTVTLVAIPAGGTFTGPGVTGNSFSPVGAGTGTHIISYTVTDGNGCTGSGNTPIVVSACVGISENAMLQSVVVYPNPNSGTFNVTVNNGSSPELTIEVVDITGRVIHTQQESNITAGFTTQVELGDAVAGTYFLRISSGNETRIEKLIVE